MVLKVQPEGYRQHALRQEQYTRLNQPCYDPSQYCFGKKNITSTLGSHVSAAVSSIGKVVNQLGRLFKTDSQTLCSECPESDIVAIEKAGELAFYEVSQVILK